LIKIVLEEEKAEGNGKAQDVDVPSSEAHPRTVFGSW